VATVRKSARSRKTRRPPADVDDASTQEPLSPSEDPLEPTSLSAEADEASLMADATELSLQDAEEAVHAEHAYPIPDPTAPPSLSGEVLPESIPATPSPDKANPPGTEPYRILTLDGGPAGLLSILVLAQLERLVPGFLAKVDLIAGTSAGAISGLMLATKADPASMLPVAENFWLHNEKYYKNTLGGLLKALAGIGPFNDYRYVEAFLQQPGVLAERKLRDLSKRVVLTSFDLSPKRNSRGFKGKLNWQPRIFHNLGSAKHDRGLRAVDVALSSSASPITTAMHDGKVDGALVANNPAMIALTQVLLEVRHPAKGEMRLPEGRRAIRMLSVGTGQSHEYIKVNHPDRWGYLPWVFNPANPLLLINAFLSAGSEAITLQAWEALGNNFCRLDPWFSERGLIPFVQADARSQQATAASHETQHQIAATARWLRKSDWMAGTATEKPRRIGKRARA